MTGVPEAFTSTGGNRTEFRRSKKLDSMLVRMRQLRTKNNAAEEESSSRFAINQRKKNLKEEPAVFSRGAQKSMFLEDRRQELYLEPRALGVTSRYSASSEEDESREDQMPDHAQDRIHRISYSKEPRREEPMLSEVPSSLWRMKSSARASEKIKSSKIASPESIQAKSYHRRHLNISLGQSRNLGLPSSKRGGSIQSIRRLEGKLTMKKKVSYDGMEQEPMIRKQNPSAHGEHEEQYHTVNQINNSSSSSDDSTSDYNSESSSSHDSSMPTYSTKNGKPVFFQFRAVEVCKQSIPYLLFFKDDDHHFFSERASNFVLGFVDQLTSYEGFPATLKDNKNENEDSDHDDSSSNLSDSESTVETYDHSATVTGENPKHDYYRSSKRIHAAKGLAKNMMRDDSFPDHLDAHQKELFAKIKEFQGRKHARRQLLGFSLAPSYLSDSSIDDTLLRGGSDESDTTDKATTTQSNISHSAIKSRREVLDRDDKALENDSTPKRFAPPHAPQEIDVGRRFVPRERFFSAKSSSVGESGNDTDYLISKIETVIQSLIKSGKIDVHSTEGKASGLHKRMLQENTAELLRNLAILRSRSSREIDHNSEGSNSGFRSSIPSESFRSPVNIETRDASRVSGNMCTDNNIAHLRAKRDKAAMAIRKETRRLSGLAVLKAPQNPISPQSPLRKKAFATHQHERNGQSPMASTQLQETVGVDTRQQGRSQTSSQNMRMDDHMAEGGSDDTSDRLERIKSMIDELRALQSSH
jgi:hypothetical protein